MKSFKLTLVFLLVLLAWAAVAAAEESAETNWFDFIAVNGLIDARIGYQKITPEADEIDESSVSDVHLFNAGLGATIEPNEYLSGTIFFLWEEEFGGEDLGIDMDEGYVTAQWHGLFGQIGKMYLPVGQFDTFAVTDPLVLELAECRQSAVGIGYQHRYFAVSAWAFNGDMDNVDEKGETEDSAVDTYAARLDVMPLAFQDRFNLALGAYLLSDAMETSLQFGGNLNERDPDGQPGTGDEFAKYEDDVAMYGGYLTAEFAFTDMFGLGIVGEYVATGEFAEEEYVDNAGEVTDLSATNVELAALLLNGTIQFGPKYESISGLDWLETQDNSPDYEVNTYTQFGGFAGYDPWEPLHLGLQVMSGSDNEDNQVTSAFFQTKLEF